MQWEWEALTGQRDSRGYTRMSGYVENVDWNHAWSLSVEHVLRVITFRKFKQVICMERESIVALIVAWVLQSNH
jgi:hypothetical protein